MMGARLINAVPQDMGTCGPEGRDCIERNSKKTFNCSVTCEGIYSDVDWFIDIEEEMEEELVSMEIDGDVGEKFKKMEMLYKKMKREMEMVKGSISKKGEPIDKLKYMELISEYKKFKENTIQHFRFNSENLTYFSEYKFYVNSLLEMLLSRREVTTFHSSSGADLL